MGCKPILLCWQHPAGLGITLQHEDCRKPLSWRMSGLACLRGLPTWTSGVMRFYHVWRPWLSPCEPFYIVQDNSPIHTRFRVSGISATPRDYAVPHPPRVPCLSPTKTVRASMGRDLLQGRTHNRHIVDAEGRQLSAAKWHPHPVDLSHSPRWCRWHETLKVIKYSTPLISPLQFVCM